MKVIEVLCLFYALMAAIVYYTGIIDSPKIGTVMLVFLLMAIYVNLKGKDQT